jgi:hypothetical protein
MADNWRKVCIIEKDPADSGSTGGMVIGVIWQYRNDSYESGWEEQKLANYTDTNKYTTVIVDDDLQVKVGWVMRDKTGEISQQ